MLSRIKASVGAVAYSTLRPLKRQVMRRVMPQVMQQVSRQVQQEMPQVMRQVSRQVQQEMPQVMQQVSRQVRQDPLLLKNPWLTGKLYPLGGTAREHIVPLPDMLPGHPKGDTPIPPMRLWEGYANSPEEYLTTGRSDMDTLLGILKSVGESPATLTRVLDFGCAAGRMLRFYPHIPGKSELWGVDINAEHIVWCQQNLSPPLLFAMATTSPHLPFEDNYFDLIYCGSVFTHISDLGDTWFLELRRILRSGGYAYITIHDERTVELLFTKYKDKELYSGFYEQVRRFDERTSVRSQGYAHFSIGADPNSQVFYDREYLVQKWSRFANVLSVTPEAHDYQTAILVQK
jgi:SAM-dependent methyltransferase